MVITPVTHVFSSIYRAYKSYNLSYCRIPVNGLTNEWVSEVIAPINGGITYL